MREIQKTGEKEMSRYVSVTLEICDDDRDITKDDFAIDSGTSIAFSGRGTSYTLFFESEKAFTKFRDAISRRTWKED